MIRKLWYGALLLLAVGLARCADTQRIPEPMDARTAVAPVTSVAPVADAKPIHITVDELTAMAAESARKDVLIRQLSAQAAPVEPVTDWRALGAQFLALIGTLFSIYQFIKKHHAELNDAKLWENLLAYCYQASGGNSLSKSLALIPAAHQEVFGSPPSAQDMAEAKQALVALHLEATGSATIIDSSREDAEMVEATKKLNDLRAAKGLGPIAAILLVMCLVGLSGCAVGSRPQSLVDAESKMVTRYEADHANLKAVANAYDQALLQAQANFATELHNERIAQIQGVVAAKPELAADGIAAAANANLTLNSQIAAQQAAQNNIRAIVSQSEATNIVQARQLDAAIRKYDNTAPFNATAAAQSAATTIKALVTTPTPIQPTAPALKAKSPPAQTPPAQAPASAGTILN